jgi:hypothetical protein
MSSSATPTAALTHLAHPLMALHGKSEMVQLKSIAVLNKMQGYNEPASVQHNHVHLQVDAAAMEQLRAGHAELGRRQQQQLAASGEANGTS